MVVKLGDLEKFVADVKNRTGFWFEIPDKELKKEIARRFGISNYIQKNIITALEEYGLIERKNLNVWKWAANGQPEENKEDQEAEKEADELIEKLDNAKAEEK
ncbi:MAG: hypothetical protein DRP12_00005 [Candidatus Aenigmatarchaeota archaeon]|nr:MAG: hypothetical protein DRP12_00005 [Candidatus Aenigmarchaeota archaeon]